MKAIDSNLLVYASLESHPATSVCETYIAGHPAWVTNIVNLLELRRVLVSVYGVTESDADAKLTDLSSALIVDDLSAALAAAALPLRQSYGVDFNDAVLLETCRRRGTAVLATDDTQLSLACAAEGIAVENPIDAAVRAQMTNWENQNLPAKGLSRILLAVHRWIEQRDSAMAASFHAETPSLSSLV